MTCVQSLRLFSQRGSVLITTTILVLMLTMMALAALSLNSTQTRIATNAADAQVAFQAAEGALNQAINNVLAGNYAAGGFLANTKGLYLFSASSAPLWSSVDWTSSSAVIQSFQGGSSAPAAFIIEQLPSVIRPGQNMKTPAQIYRITARAVGASGNSPVVLQSTVQIQP
ncbi:pilus assembly PilX family protein [Paraherbaspirillum soli]|uniref:PilX N-terminal domain-containing pilus assembly protein n=1 Tax=Paraherbaspirillum soli TaxID=631222 RepID=A0ABW0M9F7_9BURK